MDKLTRNQRVCAIIKILMENPNKTIGLNLFSQKFNAAKSTISEDLVIVRDTLKNQGMGKVFTIAGAAGGVRFIDEMPEESKAEFLKELCAEMEEPSRILPGNFLYMSDIMCNPDIIHKSALMLTENFSDIQADYVLTVETKGIPLGFEVAKLLGLNLVVVKRENKVTEGPTVNVNYVSGSNGRIQTMFLSKKAIKEGSKCIFIDDFMKAGGTTLGIMDLLLEFNSVLVGIGVLIDNIEGTKKLHGEYHSILEFRGISSDGKSLVNPTKF